MTRADHPDHAADRARNAPVPARHYTTSELEAVIRRAQEMQAGSAARAEDGISEIDVVRIGQELGLEPAMVRRAMAEVRTQPAEQQDALVRIVGGGNVRVSRMLPRSAASVSALVERYLRESELMVAQRRFPDRTRYVRDASLAAGFARFTRGFSRPHEPLDIAQLDVAVSAIDDQSCLIEISVDMGTLRNGLAAGMLGGSGGVATAWAVVVWGTTIAAPFTLLGLPLVAGTWLGMRAIYRSMHKSIQEKLESLLDRVEHNELT